MYAMRSAEPDFDGVLRRGLYPELVERAMKFARPVLAEAENTSFRNDGPEGARAIDMTKVIPSLVEAIGASVVEIILIPDDLTAPGVKRMAEGGQLTPKRRLNDILNRLYGSAVRSLSEEVRRGLANHLNRVFGIHDEKIALANGFNYAVRVCRRDIMNHFIGLAIVGDETRVRKLSGLVSWSQWLVPLAVVNEQTGFWVAHRV